LAGRSGISFKVGLRAMMKLKTVYTIGIIVLLFCSSFCLTGCNEKPEIEWMEQAWEYPTIYKGLDLVLENGKSKRHIFQEGSRDLNGKLNFCDFKFGNGYFQTFRFYIRVKNQGPTVKSVLTPLTLTITLSDGKVLSISNLYGRDNGSSNQYGGRWDEYRISGSHNMNPKYNMNNIERIKLRFNRSFIDQNQKNINDQDLSIVFQYQNCD
jgi:hypothetical protein